MASQEVGERASGEKSIDHFIWLRRNFAEGDDYCLFSWDRGASVDSTAPNSRRILDLKGLLLASFSMLQEVSGRPASFAYMDWDGGPAGTGSSSSPDSSSVSTAEEGVEGGSSGKSSIPYTAIFVELPALPLSPANGSAASSLFSSVTLEQASCRQQLTLIVLMVSGPYLDVSDMRSIISSFFDCWMSQGGWGLISLPPRMRDSSRFPAGNALPHSTLASAVSANSATDSAATNIIPPASSPMPLSLGAAEGAASDTTDARSPESDFELACSCARIAAEFSRLKMNAPLETHASPATMQSKRSGGIRGAPCASSSTSASHASNSPSPPDYILHHHPSGSSLHDSGKFSQQYSSSSSALSFSHGEIEDSVSNAHVHFSYFTAPSGLVAYPQSPHRESIETLPWHAAAAIEIGILMSSVACDHSNVLRLPFRLGGGGGQQHHSLLSATLTHPQAAERRSLASLSKSSPLPAAFLSQSRHGSPTSHLHASSSGGGSPQNKSSPAALHAPSHSRTLTADPARGARESSTKGSISSSSMTPSSSSSSSLAAMHGSHHNATFGSKMSSGVSIAIKSAGSISSTPSSLSASAPVNLFSSHFNASLQLPHATSLQLAAMDSFPPSPYFLSLATLFATGIFLSSSSSSSSSLLGLASSHSRMLMKNPAANRLQKSASPPLSPSILLPLHVSGASINEARWLQLLVSLHSLLLPSSSSSTLSLSASAPRRCTRSTRVIPTPHALLDTYHLFLRATTKPSVSSSPPPRRVLCESSSSSSGGAGTGGDGGGDRAGKGRDGGEASFPPLHHASATHSSALLSSSSSPARFQQQLYVMSSSSPSNASRHATRSPQHHSPNENPHTPPHSTSRRGSITGGRGPSGLSLSSGVSDRGGGGGSPRAASSLRPSPVQQLSVTYPPPSSSSRSGASNAALTTTTAATAGTAFDSDSSPSPSSTDGGSGIICTATKVVLPVDRAAVHGRGSQARANEEGAGGSLLPSSEGEGGVGGGLVLGLAPSAAMLLQRTGSIYAAAFAAEGGEAAALAATIGERNSSAAAFPPQPLPPIFMECTLLMVTMPEQGLCSAALLMDAPHLTWSDGAVSAAMPSPPSPNAATVLLLREMGIALIQTLLRN